MKKKKPELRSIPTFEEFKKQHAIETARSAAKWKKSKRGQEFARLIAEFSRRLQELDKSSPSRTKAR